ncbi:MAG: hypothetical protein U9N72_06465 [Bacteroidota bacterium]|nr:hypothetical protein [Bacteroidota bacterium]
MKIIRIKLVAVIIILSFIFFLSSLLNMPVYNTMGNHELFGIYEESGVDPLAPIVISVHIPFISLKTQLPKGASDNKADIPLISNGTDVISLFGDHNLKLVLQGHLHILEDIYAVGIHFITGGAVCGDWWNGPYGDTEEGFLIVNVEGEEFTWEYIDYGWTVKN